MNTTINTIIFDLDGTLLDTLADLTDSVNYVMELHNFPKHTLDEVRDMIGNGISRLMERAIPDGKNHPDFETCLVEFQEYYKSHMEIKTAPFDEILSVLEELKKQGYSLAVVSNKFDIAVKNLCEKYFGDNISIALGETPEINRKPAPDLIQKAIELLHTKKEDCIYVGDSDVDILTAQNAQMPCISVTWGFRSREFLLEHGATHLIDTPLELLRAISVFHS